MNNKIVTFRSPHTTFPITLQKNDYATLLPNVTLNTVSRKIYNSSAIMSSKIWSITKMLGLKRLRVEECVIRTLESSTIDKTGIAVFRLKL